MSTGLIIVLVIIAVLGGYLIFSISKYKNALKNFDEQNQSKFIVKLNDKNFSAVTAKGITLVDFWAAWCKPCVFLAPIINDLAEHYQGKIKVAKLDVEANKKTASKYRVMNIPTVIIFKNGKEIERVIGVKPFNYYKKLIDRIAQ